MPSKNRRNRYDAEFPLKPSERAVYGAIVTARDLASGRTRTFAVVGMTAMQAVRQVTLELDLMNQTGERWRVVTVSHPVTIRRDMYASRVVLDQKKHTTPESLTLAKLGRLDLLCPGTYRPPAYAGPSVQR